MNSILNINVSCFASYSTIDNPAKVNLLKWLTSDKYQNEVIEIRQTLEKSKRDRLKAVLPAITPSGLFSKRNEEGLIKHSGFIQFDIDLKENKHISNYNDLKQWLKNVPNIAYCGLSVSGTGYWGLIPIAYPDKHKLHFEALRQVFKRLGIAIDVKPKNVSMQKPVKLTIQNRSKLTTYLAGEIFSTVSDLDC